MLSDIYQRLSIVGKRGKIINVAEVFFDAQLFFDKVIKAVEIEVGKALAGEVANGETAPSLDGGEEGVTGEVDDYGFLLVAAVDNGVHEPEGVGTFDFAAQDSFKNLMVDAGEVFSDIALKNISTGTGKFGKSL